MKKVFASLLSLGLLLISCSAPQPTTATPPPSTDLMNTPWNDRAIFKNGLVPSAQQALTLIKGASVYHLEFEIAEDLFHVAGREEVQYTNNETVSLNEIEFRLFPNIIGGKMDVKDILIDEKRVTESYDLKNSLMILPFASPLQPGQSAVIKMDFSVTVPQEVELNYGVLAFYDNVLALGHSYPMISVYDDEGWNAEIPPQSGDLTYADASFFIVKINAPKELTLVTSGSEINHHEGEEDQTLIVASGPARDFYLAASPEYKEISKAFGEITIRSYAMPGLEEGAQLALDTAAKAIDVYSKHYAPYPYSEFDIVQTPTLALGIEYPGMVAIADRIYNVDSSIRGTPASIYMESTVAHEVGHQWFYNLVGDDQLDDPWLDESFAQFATLQYYLDEYGTQGAEGFRQSLEGRWASVGNAEMPIGLPVASYDGREYSAIVYGRGPLFLVALQEQLGEDVFNEFMKDYTTQLSWGIATPEFMQSLAETHCTCDLDALFKEWVYP